MDMIYRRNKSRIRRDDGASSRNCGGGGEVVVEASE
jgi:hypothetical protein